MDQGWMVHLIIISTTRPLFRLWCCSAKQFAVISHFEQCIFPNTSHLINCVNGRLICFVSGRHANLELLILSSTQYRKLGVKHRILDLTSRPAITMVSTFTKRRRHCSCLIGRLGITHLILLLGATGLAALLTLVAVHE